MQSSVDGGEVEVTKLKPDNSSAPVCYGLSISSLSGMWRCDVAARAATLIRPRRAEAVAA